MANPAERGRDLDMLESTLGNPAYLPSREEVLVNFGYGTVENNPLSRFGTKHNIFDYWTQEYIDMFGTYLSERVREIYLKKGKKVTILEVGAGDGRLSHFLRTRGLKDVDEECDVYAIDNGNYEPKIKRRFPVGRLSYQEALVQCQPDIVISSWMPNLEDWTPDFRATPSVKEYIVIGDSETCGTNATYGIEPSGSFSWIKTTDGAFDFRNPPGYIPPHERDGFRMTNLQNMSRLQIGISDFQHLDGKLNPIIKASRTLSFRRNN